MMSNVKTYTFLLAAFLTGAVFVSNSEEDSIPSHQNEPSTTLPQVIKSVKLDKTFDFAGEDFPLNNFDIKERLERELLRNSYYHSNTVLNIKRSSRFFPTMERILAEEGAPDDLKYLAVAESDLSNATSPAGAKGYWQFLKATGKEYGLEINSEVDERYHLEKSTKAAAKMLKKYHGQFNNWILTAAAYNAGATRIRKTTVEQGSKNFFDLNLNQETSRYPFRIVAFKEIMNHPEKYGFNIDAEDGYAPLDNYSTIEVTSSIEKLSDFAAKYGISYRMLKIYNPWLISGKLTNKSGKTYQIKIPTKQF